MLFPKAFYYTGDLKTKSSVFFTTIAILGSLIILYGLIHHSPSIFYIIGALLLTISALYFKLFYFVALELILLAGHGADYLGLGIVSKVILPIFLSLQLLIYYLLTDSFFNNIYRIIGIAGMAILTVGFAYTNEWMYLFGSLAVTIYAFYKVYIGIPIALIWAILNLIFALFSLGIIIFDLKIIN